jgi:hypothetical protein
MEVDPLSIDFGQVVSGDARVELITIANRGEAPLNIVRFDPGETDAFQVTIEARVVAPGASVEARVRFQPLALGEITGSLLVAGEGVEAKVIALRGEGVAAAISLVPAPIDFGRVLLNTVAEQSVRVTNLLEDEIALDLSFGPGIETCSAIRGAPFCVRAGVDVPLVLGPGESRDLALEFFPTTEGDEHARLAFAVCDGCAESRLELSGIGAYSALACSPRSLSFGSVLPGRCSTKAITCENAMPLPVDLISWALDGAGEFVATEFAGAAAILPGESVSAEIKYCPEERGEHRARFRVDTDPPGTITIPVDGSGGGPSIAVAPAQLDFGTVALLAPKRRSISVSNAGYAELVITGLELSDPSAGFEVSGTLDPLAPGEARTLVVELAPVVAGAVSADLIIHSNDSGQDPLRVPLFGEAVELPPCIATVRPESVSFGVVTPERFARRAVELVNQGAGVCLVYEVSLAEGSADVFAVREVPASIAPGDSAFIFVEYAPLAAGLHTGAVEVALSSPSGALSVPLSGTSAGGDLLVVPGELSFGPVGVGCASRTFEVRVHNIASLPVPIRAIDLVTPGGGFELSDVPAQLPATPVMLAPGGSLIFRATFRPEQIGPFAGAIIIASTVNGQPADYGVSLEGSGANDPTKNDRFVQLGSSMADILFVVDNSCSMGDEQVSLATNLASFIAYANQEVVDYHIAVTTLDDAVAGFGLFVPVNGPAADRVITRATQPSPELAFQQNASVGAVGPGPEMGMQAILEAFSEPNLSMHNFGFLRREAVLSIIVVSDQPDLSPQNDNFYFSFLQSLKGPNDPGAFTFSAIVGDAPSGCVGPGGTAEQGIRYIDMAHRTGGVVQSICSADWARSLEELSRIAFGFRTRFFLSAAPVPGSLEVRVDGAPVMAGAGSWMYDAAANAVQFTELATPEPASVIEVAYSVACL